MKRKFNDCRFQTLAVSVFAVLTFRRIMRTRPNITAKLCVGGTSNAVICSIGQTVFISCFCSRICFVISTGFALLLHVSASEEVLDRHVNVALVAAAELVAVFGLEVRFWILRTHRLSGIGNGTKFVKLSRNFAFWKLFSKPSFSNPCIQSDSVVLMPQPLAIV